MTPSQQLTEPLARFDFGRILGAAALLIIPAGLFAPKAIAPLFFIVLAAGLYLHKKSTGNFPKFVSPVSYGFLALAFWTSASLMWTISFDGSWIMALTLPITFLAGLLMMSLSRQLTDKSRRFLKTALLIAVVSGLSLILIEVLTWGLLHRIGYFLKGSGFSTEGLHLFIVNNSMAAFVLLFWPAALVLFMRNLHLLAICLAVFAFWVFSLSWSSASTASLAIGLIVACLAYLMHRWIHWIMAGFFAIAVLGGPFIMKAIPDGREISQNFTNLPRSVYPRIIIWQFTSNKAMERPFLGHGIRTSRFLDPGGEKIPFFVGTGENRLLGSTHAIPLHPHNGPLQVWLELGGIGAAIALGILLSVVGVIKGLNINRSLMALVYGHLMSAFALASFSFGIWQGWWQGLMWLSAAMMAALIPGNKKSLNK